MNGEKRDDMTTEILDAELEVARSKARLQQSLQVAGETGSRLATEMRSKATPALIAAVLVGGAAVVGTAYLVARREPRHRGWSRRPSAGGMVARAVGVWLLRAAALRLAQALAAKFGDTQPLTIAAPSEPG
jgi:hypothetical protein